MNENIPPEEKLLKLIRGKKQFQARDLKFPESIPENNVTRQGPGGELKPATELKLKKHFSFLNAKRAVLILFIASLICLAIAFIYPWLTLNTVKLPPLKEEAAQLPSNQQAPSLNYYIQGVKGRRIFASASSQDTEKPINAINTDLLKDISLVGIISGESPQAVIEDKNTKQTLYVTEGQYIGEIRIEDIQEGKIIINYQNARYELYL